MQEIHFHKYHGTGNDFILMNGPSFPGDFGEKRIRMLCDRHFGIGADGFIFLEKKKSPDFHMHYFNSDGRPGSMCGNGGRCAVDLAVRLGWIQEFTRFSAPDGMHRAEILPDNRISLEMQTGQASREKENTYILDTGSPHYVQFALDLEHLELVSLARKIRNSPAFREKGINVNYVEWKENVLHVRTYERGVEDETLSCGTGVCAAAIAFSLKSGKEEGAVTVPVSTKGGTLEVRFSRKGENIENLRLVGPATHVFTGRMQLSD